MSVSMLARKAFWWKTLETPLSLKTTKINVTLCRWCSLADSPVPLNGSTTSSLKPVSYMSFFTILAVARNSKEDCPHQKPRILFHAQPETTGTKSTSSGMKVPLNIGKLQRFIVVVVSWCWLVMVQVILAVSVNLWKSLGGERLKIACQDSLKTRNISSQTLFMSITLSSSHSRFPAWMSTHIPEGHSENWDMRFPIVSYCLYELS